MSAWAERHAERGCKKEIRYCLACGPVRPTQPGRGYQSVPEHNSLAAPTSQPRLSLSSVK